MYPAKNQKLLSGLDLTYIAPTISLDAIPCRCPCGGGSLPQNINQSEDTIKGGAKTGLNKYGDPVIDTCKRLAADISRKTRRQASKMTCVIKHQNYDVESAKKYVL